MDEVKENSMDCIGGWGTEEEERRGYLQNVDEGERLQAGGRAAAREPQERNEDEPASGNASAIAMAIKTQRNAQHKQRERERGAERREEAKGDWRRG